MRFLLLNTDYSAFLNWLYAEHPGLANSSYEEQVSARAGSLFSLSDFYSSNLRMLGHQAWDIDANNQFMQVAWARQHGLVIHDTPRWEFSLRRGFLPWVSRVKDSWYYKILAAQIKHYKPDVILNHAISISHTFLREMKPHYRLLILSHASAIPEEGDFGVYDVVLSSVDNLVEYFKRQGLQSERLRFGFEPRILKRLGEEQRWIPVSFVGNLFRVHASRRQWLEHVCTHVPVQVWAPSTRDLRENSPVRRCHMGTAWGVKMYEVLSQSRITLNHHIDIAEGYAGNIRLFEATGAGCLLITDWKKNLHEMFEPGKEIVTYRSAGECEEMIRYYLCHDNEREAISLAGQRRTLRDHTYYSRMQELLGIVRKYTGRAAASA